MKTRYRIIARRKIEASRRLRMGSARRDTQEPGLDDPMELSAELLDLATEELVTTKSKRGS